jgi:hypothetical protein
MRNEELKEREEDDLFRQPFGLPPSPNAPALLRKAEAPAAPRWNPQDSRGLVAPARRRNGATAIKGKAWLFLFPVPCT